MSKARGWIGPVAGGLGAGGFAWLVGVLPADATMIGLLVLAAFGLPGMIGSPEQAEWPEPDMVAGPGSWEPVHRLEMALRRAGDDGDVWRHRLQPRLAAIAAQRLERLGLSIGQPGARHALGDDLYEVVTGSAGPAGDPVAIVDRLLQRLDDLEQGTP